MKKSGRVEDVDEIEEITNSSHYTEMDGCCGCPKDAETLRKEQLRFYALAPGPDGLPYLRKSNVWMLDAADSWFQQRILPLLERQHSRWRRSPRSKASGRCRRARWRRRSSQRFVYSPKQLMTDA